MALPGAKLIGGPPRLGCLSRSRLITAITIATLANGLTLGQPAARRPEFAVASVKENKSNARPTSSFPLDRSDVTTPTGGRFFATNQPLISYLIFAYSIQVSETYGGLMRSLPAWALQDRFDIQASADSESFTRADMRSMMQSLLEDRFKLRVHRELRQVPVFALSASKPGRTGPQLKAHDPHSPCSTTPEAQPPAVPNSALVGRWPPACGDGRQIWLANSPHQVLSGGRNMTMSSIASWLSGDADLDLPISDASGLRGSFDFILQFQPEWEGQSQVANAGPAFIDALHDQLGLKLKKRPGTASFFFVDQVAYPSAN